VRNPQRLAKLEGQIIALEEEKERLSEAMTTEAVYLDPDALREHQFRLAEIERDLESKNEEWANWS
jgi:tetrahydromethanopterin S-methyltransferase subunit G